MRYPGHGLDLQGMEGECSGDDPGSSGGDAESTEDLSNEEGVEQVKDDVRGMVESRFWADEMVFEGGGKFGERSVEGEGVGAEVRLTTKQVSKAIEREGVNSVVVEDKRNIVPEEEVC